MPRMKKVVLDVGSCSIDHSAIEQMILGHFEVEVLRATGPDEALRILRGKPVHLVLVNRRLHGNHTDGMEFIRQLKSDPELAQTPVMLISDHPRYQNTAVAAGAEPGFGKSELSSPEMPKRLQPYLS